MSGIPVGMGAGTQVTGGSAERVPEPVRAAGIHVIYHRADFDGIFSGAICKKFLPEAIMHGWDFGDFGNVIPAGDTVYIVDLPPSALLGYEDQAHNVIWIDHHKSSIEMFGSGWDGYRIDGVAACRLCWHWFTNPDDVVFGLLSGKSTYINREVEEPLSVRLVGEFDIWDKRDPDAELLQLVLTADLGLAHPDAKISRAIAWLHEDDEYTRRTIAKDGRPMERYFTAWNKQTAQERSYRIRWQDLHFLVLNTARGNSLSFQGADMEGIDALMMWRFDGSQTIVSLYHAPGQEQHDLSIIAKSMKGGGHRGACGFTVNGLWQPEKGSANFQLATTEVQDALLPNKEKDTEKDAENSLGGCC